MANHMVNSAESYFEINFIGLQELSNIVRELDNGWCHCNGDPVEIMADQVFEKKSVLEWKKEMGIIFIPIPSTRHNKVVVVERKNTVFKEVLEKFNVDSAQNTKSF